MYEPHILTLIIKPDLGNVLVFILPFLKCLKEVSNVQEKVTTFLQDIRPGRFDPYMGSLKLSFCSTITHVKLKIQTNCFLDKLIFPFLP